MAVRLRCIAGPLAGEVITVEAELVLGRESSEIGKLGGDPRLSRRHARVYFDGAGRAVIQDLGSTNGTWVNDERLLDQRALVNGDSVRVGHTTLEVELAVEADATRVRPEAPRTRTVEDRVLVGPALSVVSGPIRGQEIALDDELLLGRGYGEPGALGGDPRLSRRHARIARGPGGVFFVEDLGSTNGTRLNGAQLRWANALRNGDEIEVGSSKLQTRGLLEAPPIGDFVEEPLPEPEPAAPQMAAAAAVPLAGPAAVAAEAPVAELPLFEPQGAARARLSSSRRLIVAFAVVFALAAGAAAAVIGLTAPPGSRACPQGFVCHKPPIGPPLQALSAFRGSLGWRVEYDPNAMTPSRASVVGNTVTLRESDAQDRRWGATPGSAIIIVVLHAYPSRTVSPQAALQNVLGPLKSNLIGPTTAPSSDQLFVNPVLGLHPAAGAVVEGNLRTAQGPGGLIKLAGLAASSGAVTVAAAVAYPVQTGSQQSNPDQPLDQFADEVLNTVRFPSDGVV